MKVVQRVVELSQFEEQLHALPVLEGLYKGIVEIAYASEQDLSVFPEEGFAANIQILLQNVQVKRQLPVCCVDRVGVPTLFKCGLRSFAVGYHYLAL